MRVGPLRRVLVANRGEIAARVVRACREEGLEAVVVASAVDVGGLAARMATQVVPIGPAPSSQSYLNVEALLQAALDTGCDALHPGYGYLSENAAFARRVIDAGLVWIGPPPDAIAAMGDKIAARQRMAAAGVPVVPGTLEPIRDVDEGRVWADGVGYPVLLKAAAGGGGNGMRQVQSPEDFADAFASASSEAQRSFGNGAVYIERVVLRPRHVEVQVMADAHGNVVHLFERDCSIQRRHQKVFEETPCPVLSDATRAAMTDAAVRAAKAVDYVGAGTIEFLLAEDGSFYFLEMNTRIQVEHPITEAITGVDLVRAQLRVASGAPLPWSQADIRAQGVAVECRLYAEDVVENFRPAPGPLRGYREPGGPWVRVDSGVYEGAVITRHYDPMIAKLVVWGSDRDECLARCRRALEEWHVVGVTTSIPFFLALFDDEAFKAGRYNTGWVTPERLAGMGKWTQAQLDEAAVLAAVLHVDAERSRRPPARDAAAWRRALT